MSVANLRARIKVLEADRVKHAERLARPVDPVTCAARIAAMVARAEAGTGSLRCTRVAELINRARQRADFAHIA